MRKIDVELEQVKELWLVIFKRTRSGDNEVRDYGYRVVRHMN